MVPNCRSGGTAAPADEPRHSRRVAGRVSAIPREARPFQGMRAGIVSRLLAGVVDFGVIALAVLAGYLAVAGLRFLWRPITFRFPSPSFLLLLVAGFTILVPYLAVSWWLVGRTYGDHLLGLRVVNARGERMTLWGASARAVFCALLPIGLMWVVVSSQDRSLQDLVLRTSVIYDWEVGGAAPDRSRRVGGGCERAGEHQPGLEAGGQQVGLEAGEQQVGRWERPGPTR
jgi:uncharacterized RDD family membrane protein YckC